MPDFSVLVSFILTKNYFVEKLMNLNRYEGMVLVCDSPEFLLYVLVAKDAVFG